MKVSMAALSFLILAVALGSQGRVIDELRESGLMDRPHHAVVSHGFQQPSDCCPSYTSRIIRCASMKGYFETSSGCSKPGVIFITRQGQLVCANPRDEHVQGCMDKMRRYQLTTEAGTMECD